jgi:hypothetical protein
MKYIVIIFDFQIFYYLLINKEEIHSNKIFFIIIKSYIFNK